VQDTIHVGLKGVADITGATAVGHVKLDDGPTINLSGGTPFKAVADADGPAVMLVPLGSWLVTASQGEWRYETTVTFTNGSVITWPSKGYDLIIVTEDLD
jgi:hypothetical protein